MGDMFSPSLLLLAAIGLLQSNCAPVYDPSWQSQIESLKPHPGMASFKDTVAGQSQTLSSTAAQLAKDTVTIAGKVNDQFKVNEEDKKKNKNAMDATQAETKAKIDEMEEVIKETEKANKATRDAEALASKLKTDAASSISDAAGLVQSAKMQALTETAQAKASTAGTVLMEKINMQAQVDALTIKANNALEEKTRVESKALKDVSATLLDGSKNFEVKSHIAVSRANAEAESAKAAAMHEAAASAMPETLALQKDITKAEGEIKVAYSKIGALVPSLLAAKSDVDKVLLESFSAISDVSEKMRKSLLPPEFLIPAKIGPAPIPEVRPILQEVDTRMKELGFRAPTPMDAFVKTAAFDPAKELAGVPAETE